MWLTHALIFCVLLAECFATLSEWNSELRPTEDNPLRILHDPNMEEMLKKFLTKHANCSRTDWACNQKCRVQFADRSTGVCRRPLPDDHCFGIPITYNYTFNANHIISLLPRYEVLSRFPRCWSSLGPLLCAVAFRPCSNRTYFELTMSQPGRMEIWQVFRKDMCYRAREHCGFAIANDLWPNFIDCSDTVGTNDRPMFSDGSCQMPYKEAPSTMNRRQCLWPLVESNEKIRDAHPLIDDCYLPCRSPLVSSDWLHSGFKMFVLIVSAFVFLLTFLCFIYISFFSHLWVVNLCVYALGHALLSASAHWALLMSSFSESFARRAMCTADGHMRRTTESGVMDWCFVETFLLHFSLLSGMLWLCAFLVIRLGRPPVRLDHMVLVDGRPSVSVRCLLLFVYLMAACVTSFALWMNAPEADGLLGVCYIGLRSSRRALLIYVPLWCALLFSLLCAAALFVRRRYLAMLELDARDAEAARVEEVDNPKKNGEMLASAVAHSTELKSHCEAQPLVSSEVEEEAVDDEELKEKRCSVVVSLNAGELRENEGEPYKENRPMARLRRIYRRKPDGCGCSAVSLTWTWTLCAGMFASALASSLIYISMNLKRDTESDMVLQSVMCSLRKSVQEGKHEWLNATGHSDHLISSIRDPIARKRLLGSRSLNAEGCELLATGDTRLPALFFAVVMFPSVPFILTAIFVLAGFCAFGLKGVEKVRERLNPFVVIVSTDNTYQTNSRGTCEELNLLPSSTGSVRASQWDTSHQSTSKDLRLCASADCINKDVEANSSLHTQTWSEPTGLNSTKSHVRRIDLLQRSAERRRRQQEVSMNTVAHSAHSASDLQRLLALSEDISKRSTASFNSDIRSSYSDGSRESLTSFNLTSASQQRDPVFEAAAMLSAYQTGLVEGHWQERCSRYVDQIKALTETLQVADSEIRRLSGLPSPPPPTEGPSERFPCIPSTSSAPLIGLSYLSAMNFPQSLRQGEVSEDKESSSSRTARATGSEKSERVSSVAPRLASGGDLPGTSGLSSVPNRKLLKTESDSTCSKCSKATPGKQRVRIEALPVGDVEGSSEDAGEEPKKADKNSKVESDEERKEDWMVDDAECDSDLFRSDEEDEDEERMFNAMLEELKMEQQAGGSNTESSLDDGNNPSLTSSNSSTECEERTPVKEMAGAAPSASETPTTSSALTSQSADPTAGTTSGKGPPVYLLPSLSAPTSVLQQRALRAPPPQISMAPGSSSVRGVSPRMPMFSIRHGAPVVTLSEEQQRQLLQLRSQLTERDLIYYSDHFRQLALQQARTRAALFGNSRPPGQGRPQQGVRARPPAPIREEDEEVVMDPYSSASDVGAASSTVNNNRRPGEDGGGTSESNRRTPDGDASSN